MKLWILPIVLLISVQVQAQVFDVDTIYSSGSIASRINVVILSDGYLKEDMEQFHADATAFVDRFLTVAPFDSYRNYFNFFAIRVPSNERGADHPGTATDVSEPAHPVEDVDNYFGSTFDYYSIHRLLVPINRTGIYQVLASNFPQYDQVAVLVNSPHYGGSGGEFSTASLHTLSVEVALHEMGHSFGGLADEYYAGDSYASERVNMTQETNPEKVRWKNWIGTDGTGIYQHCCGDNSALWYRPHQNCKMRTLNAPFCPVCTQALVERIHTLAPPILSYSPVETEIKAQEDLLTFYIEKIPTLPNTLKVFWELNDESTGDGSDTLSLDPAVLADGDNYLSVYVEDTTSLLRVDGHSGIHLYSVLWTIGKEGLGTYGISGRREDIQIRVYPNPVSGILNIRFLTGAQRKVRAEMSDMTGRVHRRIGIEPGQEEQLNMAGLKSGVYSLKFYAGPSLVGVRKVVIP